MRLARKIEAGTIHQLDWYKWKASELEKRITEYVDGRGKEGARILEIGAGPIGIVSYLEWGQRFAIDPLEDFYGESPILAKLRKPEVTYLKGMGEHLPFPDRFFSLVIIDNVIDHTHAPVEVLRQVNRVLEDGSIVYLAVNIRTPWGTIIHKLLAALYLDKGHPHTFTKESARDLIVANHFRIRAEEVEDYDVIKQKNCRSGCGKGKIKGYTGMSEFEYRVIGQKICGH